MNSATLFGRYRLGRVGGTRIGEVGLVEGADVLSINYACPGAY